MGWIFSIAVTAVLLVTGTAELTSIALYRVSKFQMD